ncbi:metal ABC transporter ATP-binding protein [Clostridium sp. MSJ-11]|uniref:Metal ABC transporter ATP-binding protein n=1 Tax=Clostridium mobile TaxID=2841512 RepID=A0ABS6EJM6_9CLOT|nr:metal ABC transporter ATP-binding protein [Clostridium mobile]MBU5485406.1 metal ABC transporter ATP-binding protein [Clostridium mobile]
MINIDNLCFSYNGSTPYGLNNINLHINKGSYVSIIGENGSYKSTMLKLILGLIKPCQGSVSINTNKIGYVPQRANFNTDFPITVYEILKCHAANLKIKDKNVINQCLEQMCILDLKNSLIGNLSGGQQQKVFISRSLVGHPDLLILDEPSTGIDLKSQDEIYTFLRELNKNHGITIVSVEHNLKAVTENSTHIVKMTNGEMNFYTIEDFLQ